MQADLGVIPLLAVLAGLVWHIHVALIPPLLLAFGLVVWQWKKVLLDLRSHPKKWAVSLAIFLVLMAPFFAFEVRHGFWQTRGLFLSAVTKTDEIGGIARPFKVTEETFREQINLFVYNSSFDKNFYQLLYFPFGLTVLAIFLKKLKVLSGKQLVVLALWPILVIFIHSVSKRSITEYYFYNIFPVTLLIVSSFVSSLIQFNRLRLWALLGLAAFTVFSVFTLINRPDVGNSYLYKEELTGYIQKDAQKHHYPCISVNYIAKFGTAVGFRYLFWWKNLPHITPGNDVPVYNVALPYMNVRSTDIRFGSLGLIMPQPTQINPAACSDPNRQLEPLLGFTN